MGKMLSLGVGLPSQVPLFVVLVPDGRVAAALVLGVGDLAVEFVPTVWCLLARAIAY